MKLRPLNNLILIVREDAPTQTEGGIFLPDKATKKANRGVVVAKGRGKTLESGHVVPIEVEIGDTVYFGDYMGAEVVFEGREYMFLREGEVFGRIPAGE